nr:uncharacterized mitochondrial protein AtMg00810-like [Tanacetum cinerariifolium]
CDDLINKVNLKSVEVADLNASLQEKVFVITALKEQLKGKAVLPKAVFLNPIDPALLQIQELLMILQQTCPRITDLGTKLVAVTRKNQTKQVRRTPQITKSEKPSVGTSPSPNIDSNTHVLSSTGVALVSSTIGSQSKDNTKKNRIRRTLKKAKETDPRKVKSSLNKEMCALLLGLPLPLWYPKDSSITLIEFADADHAGCQDTRRSTSG